MLEIFKDILTDQHFIGALLISLSFILLGYFLRVKNILNDGGKKLLNFLTLKVALPALAFSSFMADFDPVMFKENILLFVFSMLLFLLILALGNLIFIKNDSNDRRVKAIFIAVGQITFFSTPILKTMYSGNLSEIMIPANMVTLAFRFYLYIYCYFVISKLKFTKEETAKTCKTVFLNPIMIMMILGLFIWATQSFMPKVNIDGVAYSFLRIDKTLPSLFMIISAADKLTTPLAMLIIGGSLGDSNIKEAIKDKTAWFISLFKTLGTPLIVLGLSLLLQWTNILHFNEFSLTVIVICFAAPLSAVISAFSSQFKNNEILSSRSCLLSTVLCIITFPLLFIIIRCCLLLPIFG